MVTKKQFIITLMILLSIPFSGRAAEPVQQKDLISRLNKTAPVYLFSYFKGDGSTGLHLMYSHDGLVWKNLNQGQPLLTPNVGDAKLMRDPSIVRDRKGVYHMVWTTGWNENHIGYASSTDLIHWSEQKSIPVMAHEPEVRNSWAPEIYHHRLSGYFYIVWASTIPDRFPGKGSESDYNHRLYYTRTKDFVHFSPTELFYDPGFNVIDGFIIKERCMYHMFVKDETLDPIEKNIRVVSARNLKKFPKDVSAPLTGLDWAEGPTAIKIGKYTYLYWDKYRNKRYGALRTKNVKKGEWEDISDIVKFPSGLRHGTAFKADEATLRGLQALDKD